MTTYEVKVEKIYPEEPSDITKVKDRHGDVWEKQDDQWLWKPGRLYRTWNHLVETYGPLIPIAPEPKKYEVRKHKLSDKYCQYYAIWTGEEWVEIETPVDGSPSFVASDRRQDEIDHWYKK